MDTLKGHIAIITGAAGGIGAAIAHKFGNEGASVALLDSDYDAILKYSTTLKNEGINVIAVKVDVSNEESVLSAYKKIISEIGDADILVNSAAIADGELLNDITVDQWDKMMAINVRGTFLCCREVLLTMKRKGWGRIINIASEVAHRGHPGLSHYAASKAAVIAMTKCLALEVVGDNIRANVLSPGPTETGMMSGLDPDTVSNLITELMPIGRLARPEEIAAAALYLASPEADFCVGSTLSINGGTHRM